MDTEDTPEELGTGEDFEMDADACALIDDLVQIFDDFLWSHNGKIENKEQQQDDWSNQDLIYGTQRDELVCQIFESLQCWGII